ncbi:MAG: lysophospholipid acyltransferase family protein [Candidatus Cloacimonetes bacterium]|nr:lysophospholipid acyltransferase family protein [Candidatus Cloacimonadota bacterium]
MKHKILLNLVEKLGPSLIKLLMGTLRIKEYDKHNLISAKETHGTVIYAFWHNRMLIPAYTHINQFIHVLISQHKDGEFIARVVIGLGFGTIRGSSRRGGMKALKEAVTISKNYDIAFTPDGPTGPKEIVKDGVLYLAYRTGKPIIPGIFIIKSRWELNSWDNFMIPKPFSPVKMIYGKPIFVNSKSEIPEKREELQRLLTAYSS